MSEMITHDELKGWITALAAGKKISQADTQRLATELLNTRAELYFKNKCLNDAYWQAEELEEKIAHGLGGQVSGRAFGDCAVADGGEPVKEWYDGCLSGAFDGSITASGVEVSAGLEG